MTLKFSRHVAYSHRSLFLTAFSIKSRQLVYSVSLTFLRLLSLTAINLDRGNVQSHLHVLAALGLKATIVSQQQEFVNMKSKTSVAIRNERRTALLLLYKQYEQGLQRQHEKTDYSSREGEKGMHVLFPTYI